MTDTPTFSPQEQQGLRDYHAVYEENYDEITADLMKVVERLPQLNAIVKRMNQQQLEEQRKQSRELLRRAIHENAWGPLLQNSRESGATYAALNVSFTEWFELVSSFQSKLVPVFMKKFGNDLPRASNAITAMNRYIDVVMSVIGDEYLRTKERIISQQQTAIAELSTPVLQIRERLLLMPLVGLLDTQRARLMTEQLLQAIRQHRAKAVVIDITGVAAVDSKVANHLFQTVAAARLMGAMSVVTGLSAGVAQALVALGIDVEKLNTAGDLQGGLEEAERMLGYSTRRDTTSSEPQV
jgi:rsbT co-antagonist protein RsbR